MMQPQFPPFEQMVRDLWAGMPAEPPPSTEPWPEAVKRPEPVKRPRTETYVGRPCRLGHGSLRYRSNWSCVKCCAVMNCKPRKAGEK